MHSDVDTPPSKQSHRCDGKRQVGTRLNRIDAKRHHRSGKDHHFIIEIFGQKLGTHIHRIGAMDDHHRPIYVLHRLYKLLAILVAKLQAIFVDEPSHRYILAAFFKIFFYCFIISWDDQLPFDRVVALVEGSASIEYNHVTP